MTPADDRPTGGYAVLTSPGPAAIAVVRIRGPHAGAFLTRYIRTRRPLTAAAAGDVRRAELLDADGSVLDDIVISVHGTPPAWDVRVHLHGNPQLVRRCTELAEMCDLRAAEAPDMGLWAVQDALEAEAYALLPQMATLRGAQWLLGQTARLRDLVTSLPKLASLADACAVCRQVAARTDIVSWFAQPLRVALVGPVNVGKSTLANALADRAVSIVSPAPGTTRDWVEIQGEARGFPVTWLDTAGLRDSTDALEAASVARSRALLEGADAVIVVLDGSPAGEAARTEFLAAYAGLTPACVALNKCDLGDWTTTVSTALPTRWRDRALGISATCRAGLDDLGRMLLASAGRRADDLDVPAAYTPRQAHILLAAAAAPDANTLYGKLLQLSAPAAGS